MDGGQAQLFSKKRVYFLVGVPTNSSYDLSCIVVKDSLWNFCLRLKSVDNKILLYILQYMSTHNTTMLIKTDKELKTRAQFLAEEIGIPLTTVINAYLKQFVRDRHIVFDAGFSVKEPVAKRLRIIRGDFKNGKNVTRHKSLDALFSSFK